MSLCVLLTINIYAQKAGKMHKMTWKEIPELHQVKEEYKDESVIIIQDHRYLNYKKNLDSFIQYKTVHKIIKANDEVGVKATNQISIPMRQSDYLLRLDVRTLSPSGKLTTLDQSSIKQIKSEEGYNVRKFAVEGLEAGGEVEYIYTIQTAMRSYGREYFQTQSPVQSAKFQLYMPNQFTFVAKSYNGLNKVKYKEYRAYKNSYTSKDYIEVIDSNIAPFTREGLSDYRSKLKRVDYKVQGSQYVSDYLTWEKISKRMVENIQSGKGEMKVIKFFKGLDLKSMPLEERIAAIEYKIKSEIKIERNGGAEYSDLGFVVKNKLANYSGLFALYMKSFVLNDIDLNLVMAADRFNGQIDVDFPHGMDLDFPIFYFPEIKKYITPHNLENRLGYPSPEFAGANDALHIILTPVYLARSSYAYEGYRMRPLPTMDMNMTKNSTTAIVNVVDDEAQINYIYSSTGFRAASDRMYMKAYLLEDDNLQKHIIRGIDDIVVETHKFENDDLKYSLDPIEPFKLKAQLKSKSLVESLGDDKLIKIGLLIGTQSKLYTEENRENDVVLRYKKYYDHHIQVQIPEGYKCSNLEEFKKDIVIKDEEDETLFFHLNYTLTNNVLDISVKEGYNTLEVKKEDYQDYRKIVNSAADFNALNVVLEKL